MTVKGIEVEEVAVSAVAGYRTLYSRLYELALAIREFEGWFPGSRSFRNKNPGNLRDGAGNIGNDSDGFARFETYHHGMYALLRDLHKKCIGATTTSLGPGSDLRGLVEVYAPTGDGNHVGNYVQFLVARLSKPETTRLLWFVEG